MKRVSLKVTGAQGQGVNSVGEICATGLKRGGYCVFGYREYMSLIKGGHSSYQLDISQKQIGSSETLVDILICFNHHGLERNIRDVKPGGIVLHQTLQWKFPAEDDAWVKQKKISVVYLPIEDLLKEISAPPILANVFITSVVWSMLKQDPEILKNLVREQFGHKGEKVLALNFRCIDEGVRFRETHAQYAAVALPEPDARWKDCMLLTGSQAIGLGAIHAGCRMYVGYPMTPSSPLLSFIGDMQNRTGMVIKQAEDEITAAQMMSGAMFMGTRAMTATSGGGFDLMTETLSLNGIIENPSVFGLAMRPGPATGLPTWTAQGDLLLAVFGGHGEFARCVLSASDSQDAFDLMPVAFNIAEKYQISVVVLFDKQIAEALYTQPLYDQKKATIDRGHISDAAKLKKLRGTDRYDSAAKDGISPRWLPGSVAATYVGQGDEHSADGSVDETAQNAIEQMDKRMRKHDALKAAFPEPQLYGAKKPQTLLIGWGSTKGPMMDLLSQPEYEKVGYLHYTHMWPLKTERFVALAKQAKTVVLVEGNKQGQLGMLLQQEACIPLPNRVLKYDGRPFFVDELHQLLTPFLP
jgi:2-oxoglutarate ferredoxin oxidoreductase subunit alpha